VDGTQLTLSNTVSGAGSLDKTGTGTLVLSATNTYSGVTTVDGGTIAITDVSALGASSAGTTVNAGGTLDIRNVTGVAEPLTINGGTLATSTGTSSVTSPVALTGNTTIDVDGTQLTLSNTVSGAGSLDKTGTGTLVLSATNTYSGATTVDGGTIAITDVSALGASSAGTTVNAGGTLDIRNVTGVAEPLTINGGTLATSTGTSSVTSPINLASNSSMDVDGTLLTITNVISGTGGFSKTGSGELLLEFVNTYTGSTIIDSGTLTLAAGASIAESQKVVVNGTFDASAITENLYIKSLAGAGLVINGSVAPNSLIITDAIPGEVFFGVISGTGGLKITGGTQTLTGINTYTGPTIVSPGANLIASIQSIPGDVVNNGSFGFNQSTAGSYTHNMSGTGSMDIGGTGVITLTGTNTQTGGTTIQSGASLIIGSSVALSGNRVNSNGGSLGISTGITLAGLNVIGSVNLTTDIITTGAQTYENIKLAPSAGDVINLNTVNSDIRITGRLDGSTAKAHSIVINAGTGQVTLGDSVGSIARPNRLTVTGSRIFILADILTGDKQEYNGATSIGDGTYIGKAFVAGFLLASHYQYFEYVQGGVSSSVDYKNNDPRYVRTLVSKDPTVTFNGTVDDVTDFAHTLLVAAITNSQLAQSTTPIINFNNSVSQTIPLYSLNVQTHGALDNSDTPNLASYVGKINLIGNVKTYSNQMYRSSVMNAQATIRGGDVVFEIYDPAASINFALPLKNDNSGQMNLLNPGTLDGLTINGSNNFKFNPNLSGADNWGKGGFKQGNALNYVAPSIFSALPTTLDSLKRQAELPKESNLVFGEVTVDEIEESSECTRTSNDQVLDPKCDGKSI
jgi:autotransporter-associated beta strand protein